MHSSERSEDLDLSVQREYRRQQERLKAMSNKTQRVLSISADLMIENFLKESSFKSSKNERSDLQFEIPIWLRCESLTVPPEYKYFWSLVQSNIHMADTQKVSQLLLTSGLPLEILGHIWNLTNKVVPGQLTKQEFYIVLALVNLAQSGMTFGNLSILNSIQSPVIPILQIDSTRKQISELQPKNEHIPINPTQQQHSIQMPFQFASPNHYREVEQKICSTSEAVVMNKPLNAFNSNLYERNISLTLGNRENPIKEGGDSNNIKFARPNASFQNFNNKPYSQADSLTIQESEDDFSDFQSVSAKHKDFSQLTKSHSNLEDSNDEFSDFQCATIPNKENLNSLDTVILQKKREIPKILLPKNLTRKYSEIKSNMLKISPESEKKLKVLSKNESLSSLPESKISTNNKVSTSISVLGSNHEIGSRLANHSLGAKLNRSNLHKQHKTKSPPKIFPPSQRITEEEIIFGVNTKNFDSVIPKCCPKKPGLFILKETKINDRDSSPDNGGDQLSRKELDIKSLCSMESTRKIEIPLVGTFNETVLPTQAKAQSPTRQSSNFSEGSDLFSLEEDKYSALREIQLSNSATEEPMTSSVTEGSNDDFGDFLSAAADLPPSNNVTEKSFLEPQNNYFNLLAENKVEDGWGDWNCNKILKKETSGDSLAGLNQLIPDDAIFRNEQPSRDIKKDYNSFNLFCPKDEDSCELSSIGNQQETTFDKDSSFLEFSSAKTEETTLGFVDNEKNREMDESTGKSAIENNKRNNNESLVLTNNTNLTGNEIWDLFGPSAAPSRGPSRNNLTRQDSLPSLDFKISLGEESEQEEIWRKCLETCQAMIQEGVEILEAIERKEILREVFATPKTADYLNGLKIAYEITRRISKNYSNSLSVQEDLNRLWSKLEKLSLEYNVQIKEDIDSLSDGTSHCKICLASTGANSIHHGGNTYHPSCANLWINCIDGNLPFAS